MPSPPSPEGSPACNHSAQELVVTRADVDVDFDEPHKPFGEPRPAMPAACAFCGAPTPTLPPAAAFHLDDLKVRG
eukprot:CAMPEP_0170572830 /NCGR_PEP_ID=MMETSP0224-20130122/2435_1 /TAXON_ID=285029 /ORGANISM="Togula jolla, Strain CCCM 725" /LENGTH=74 /DNA_ID=CAMNT_0010895365 /DNA_START=731 /DNA_END=955 /DNA_ORIENTATION=-